MDKTLLVENYIKDGEKFISLLKDNDFDIKYAFWAFLEEYHEWRLVIAMPKIRVEGKMKYYEKIQNILLKNNFKMSVPFDSIMIVDVTDNLINTLKKIKVENNNSSGYLLAGYAVNGSSFPESYLYNIRN